MAHLHRLIFALLLLLTGSAHALIPKVTGYSVNGGPLRDTPAAACAAYGPIFASSSGVTFLSAEVNSDNRCVIRYRNAGGDDSTSFPVGHVSAGICPANSSEVSGGCQCTAPYTENAAQTACEAPPDPCLAIKGAIYGEIEWASTTKGNNYGCLGGEGQLASCQTVAVCDYTSQVPGQIGFTCRGNSYANGNRSTTCSGTGETPQDPSKPPATDPANPDRVPTAGQPAPARCPVGQAPGTFNGTRICAPTGPDTQTSGPAPGSGSTTTNNSDGSSTTSTTTGSTTCLQGKCTTSTVNTNVTINAPGNETCPAGQTSGTTTVNGQARTTCTGTASGTTSQAQTDFCKSNPKDKQCGGDGADTSFGGTCAAGFKAVSDDAVINAMAEETFRQNCKVNPDEASQTIGREEAAKTGNQTGSNPNNSAVTIGPSYFDNSDALGASATCIGDKSIVVMGKSIVIAFSMICQYLEALGLVMVGVSSLLAARIVTRG